MSDDYENCPICNEAFPLEKLINHASNCNGKVEQTSYYVRWLENLRHLTCFRRKTQWISMTKILN
jgi:hypothetical protein